MAKTIEKGNIFYFYRPKVEAESPKDVQRFYFVLHHKEVYRLIIVGAKKLPVDPGGSSSLGRNWAWIRAVTEDKDTIEDILSGGEYKTETKGTRHLPPAAPLGEGRYAIVQYGRHTELVYRLKRGKSGEIKDIFGLEKEASLVIAVKNPDVHVEGFPEAKPDIPAKLKGLFKDRRWIPVEDPRLLHYEDVQMVLISARDKNAAQELGIEIEPDVDLLSEIDLDLPDEALLENTFPGLEEFEERHHELKAIRFGAGGKKGGRKAARVSSSASGLARLLSGVGLPKRKRAIEDYAEEHKERLDDPSLALERLAAIPDREYRTMADIQEAVSEAAGAEGYDCYVCGRSFDTRSELQQHLRTSHPEQAVSAADIEKALSGISYPAEIDDLMDHADKKNVEEKIRDAIDTLPDREYHDAAEVAAAFQEAITGEQRKTEEPPSKKALKSDSAAAVTSALKGIKLPGSKNDLVKYAKNKKRRKEIVEILEAFPDKKYHDMSDIAKAIGEAKD